MNLLDVYRKIIIKITKVKMLLSLRGLILKVETMFKTIRQTRNKQYTNRKRTDSPIYGLYDCILIKHLRINDQHNKNNNTRSLYSSLTWNRVF